MQSFAIGCDDCLLHRKPSILQLKKIKILRDTSEHKICTWTQVYGHK